MARDVCHAVFPGLSVAVIVVWLGALPVTLIRLELSQARLSQARLHSVFHPP